MINIGNIIKIENYMGTTSWYNKNDSTGRNLRNKINIFNYNIIFLIFLIFNVSNCSMGKVCEAHKNMVRDRERSTEKIQIVDLILHSAGSERGAMDDSSYLEDFHPIN